MKSRKLRKLASAIVNRKRPLVYGIVIMLAAVITALGCGWNYITDHSVRFGERAGREFYRLPPLPVEYDPVTGRELSTIEIEQYDLDYDTEENGRQEKTGEPDQTWDGVRAAIDKDDLSNVRELLEKFLELTKYKEYWDGYDNGRQEQQKRRNTAFDLLDAMNSLHQGSKADGVRVYLKARLAFGTDPTEVENLINSTKPDRNLSDNWEYLLAANLYRADQRSDALNAFKTHTRKFPQSEKNESAMYMIAKLTMEQGDALAKECENEKCEISEWRESLDLFREMMRKHPNGRYFLDARGWIAHLYRHEEKIAESLAEYYRLLGNPTGRQWRLEAKKSLQIIGHEYDDGTLNKVEALIADEPDTALAYAYHRIYNQATDLTYDEFNEWCCYGDDKWNQQSEETQRLKKAHDTGRHELERVAKFATAMVKRYGQSRLSGDFVLRVAEAQLELQNFKDALTLADRSLALDVKEDSRAQALWVKGSAEHQQKKLTAARATFSRLIKEFADHKLTEGARRLLAMTAEDQNDLEFALDQYIALGYEDDVAYFVDVLLPTDRLAKFVYNRENSPQFNQLLYSLGVRYMRDRRWDDARATLRKVRTHKETDSYLEHDRNATWFFAKEPGYGEDISNIKTSWVVQDLQTIDVFEHYERAVESAQGDEQKVEALYQLASRFFEADDLVFYNPSAWNGRRTGRLGGLIFSDYERLPNESHTVFEHMQAHDPLVTAIVIYEDIAARFPQTTQAKDALYSAAVAHERLSGRNALWTTMYERGFFAGPRMISYADVRNIFPDYQLPRGTYGWKPSTRTVNGGSPYPPPPKPAPKLTRTQRIERKLQRWFREPAAKLQAKAKTVVDQYDSLARSSADFLVAFVFLMAVGYASMLTIHFRSSLEASQLDSVELPLEDLPHTESRVERMLDS